MNAWLLGLVAIVYSLVALNFALQGQYGMSLAFFAYALANIGFMFA